MSELFKRANLAIKVNPPTGADFHITQRGSDWLFTVFCLMIFGTLVLSIFLFKKPVQERKILYTVMAPMGFMSLTYFTMASNLGWTPIRAEFDRINVKNQSAHPGYRQIFYARYVGWFLSFPWIIVQASILGGTPWKHTFFNVAMTEVWVVTWLIGALIKSTYKWGYYVFGVAAGFICAISVMTTTRNLLLQKKDHGLEQVFYIFFSFVMGLWIIYPVAFALSEGGNILQPDSEHIFYGALDVCMLFFMPLLFLGFTNYLGPDRLNHKHADAESAGSPKIAQTPMASPKVSSPKSSKSSDKKKHKKKHSKKSKK